MTSILLLNHQRPDGEVDRYHLKSGRRYHLGRGSQCQVRILDLKLSRQHCAFECGDTGWTLVDLASTNGCAVDGERVAGSRPLRAGSVVTAGTTSVTVERILDEAEDIPAPHPPTPQSMPATPADGSPAPWPQQAESEPPRASDRLAAAVSRSSEQRADLEPQPSRKEVSDPLIPAPPRSKPAARPPEPTAASVDQDVLATMAPAQRPAEQPADGGSRTFYINLLGKRVGPLTRQQARDLKARELRGSLTPADLAAITAADGAAAPETTDVPAGEPAAVADDQRTYYITVLGQRVGPLTRQQARDLKARELRGSLGADEVERLIAR
ncbi:MAG: FHA domain-containing protein [Planctomycetes bacterium]|nr:FHA domain-containing protein [Planctomycetota bacterium]